MKAVQIDAPESLKFIYRPQPDLQSNEVLIKVKVVGICGTDLKLYDGTISYLKDGSLTLPLVPGHEWSGEVFKVGSSLSKFKVGERVTGECHIGCGSCEDCRNGQTNICYHRERIGIFQNGALSDYIVLPERAVHTIPDEVTDVEGAMIEPLTVALHALDKLDRVAGSRLLVYGLGPIGLLISQVAKSMGATTIIGVDINETALRRGKNFECDEIINSKKENVKERVLSLTNQEGPDIIVEATGVSDLLVQAVDLIRSGGQLSLIGLFSEKADLDPNQLITKDVKIIGNMASSARIWQRANRISRH
ncbi:zinc-dependent alcohol dehydrogenase [Salicibibacter cibarius]|uniref:zinc-dependent alcohol dehydrogenase n=1 Tax=Salicibibacter cibarius TaxID=2743000 RepID=UPI001B7D8C1D|nr:alcohol dehydrogenase catalytic domain-containing protein [Salicibibacter cibarius]